MGDGLYINLDNLPVPDLEKWATKCIRWPISLNSVFIGLLQQLAYPDIWDGTDLEKSTMTAVINTFIVDLMLGVECEVATNGNGDNGDGKEYPVVGLEALESECDCMAGCSIPYGALRWNDGTLQYLYCGVWYDVEGTTAVDKPIGDDFEPPEIDGGGYSACGKAEAVMSMVDGVLQSIFDQVGNLAWQFWPNVKNANPGVHMDAKWIVTACYGAVNQAAADAAAGDSYDPDAFDPSVWQTVKCALAREFSPTLPEVMNGNEIRTFLQNNFAQQWGTDLLTNAVFVDALRGINKETFEDFVRTGAYYDDADCDCPVDPDEPSIPLATGWYLSAPRTFTHFYDTDKNNGYQQLVETLQHDIYGVAVEMDVLSGSLSRWGRGIPTESADATYWGSVSDNFNADTFLVQWNSDVVGQELLDSINSPKTMFRTAGAPGPVSGDVNTPVATAGEKVAIRAFAEASSGSGSVRWKYRLIHNIGSASHQ